MCGIMSSKEEFYMVFIFIMGFCMFAGMTTGDSSAIFAGLLLGMFVGSIFQLAWTDATHTTNKNKRNNYNLKNNKNNKKGVIEYEDK